MLAFLVPQPDILTYSFSKDFKHKDVPNLHQIGHNVMDKWERAANVKLIFVQGNADIILTVNWTPSRFKGSWNGSHAWISAKEADGSRREWSAVLADKILAHEVGHGLGIGHAAQDSNDGVYKNLMHPNANARFPSPYEVRYFKTLFGERPGLESPPWVDDWKVEVKQLQIRLKVLRNKKRTRSINAEIKRLNTRLRRQKERITDIINAYN